jgi:hypothetical protein
MITAEDPYANWVEVVDKTTGEPQQRVAWADPARGRIGYYSDPARTEGDRRVVEERDGDFRLQVRPDAPRAAKDWLHAHGVV